jgi:pyrroloquinoline quinone biosynthesis protein D
LIAPHARPRLASKVRLRFDRHAQRHMLIYPERGMLLNESAAAIAELCTGDNSLDMIVDRLLASRAGATREELSRDVQAFLSSLLERALIQLDP